MVAQSCCRQSCSSAAVLSASSCVETLTTYTFQYLKQAADICAVISWSQAASKVFLAQQYLLVLYVKHHTKPVIGLQSFLIAPAICHIAEHCMYT